MFSVPPCPVCADERADWMGFVLDEGWDYCLDLAIVTMPKDFQFTLSVFELPGFTPWRQTVWLSGVSFMHFFSFLKVYLQIRYPVGMKIIWYSPDKKGSKLQPCHFATWSVVLVINHVSPSLVFLKDDILKRKREKKSLQTAHSGDAWDGTAGAR